MGQPLRAPGSAGRRAAGVGLVHRLPALADHGPGQSFLGALGAQELWAALAEIGVEAIHTGPLKLAGGISGWLPTPSVDGHFDRISMQIDPVFGTEEEFREMCANAARRRGTIIDDIVPGHTGKGADFRLAELNYLDYPGIYHMVDIPEDAWHLLPDVPEGQDAVNLTPEAKRALAEAGYIIGELQRVIFYEPGVKETNWSVTPPIYDWKGVLRRWVYLHYFKEGQPSINWLDPTFAGMRLVMGDALHSLGDLGSGACGWTPTASSAWRRSNRATGLVGGPPAVAGREPADRLDGAQGGRVHLPGAEPRHGRHPVHLGRGARPLLRLRHPAGLPVRAGHRRHRVPAAHAARGDAPLGVDQASLVHALQNHDELTYELVHFARHREDTYSLGGVDYTGAELAEQVRETMRRLLTGAAAPYNAVFVQNGIACTTASIIAASLGITDLDSITDADVRRISNAHLLLCMYNAWQPGVFALSGWDLVGALPLDRSEVKALVATGDTRWIERGSYDLLGAAPDASKSSSGMPRAVALYGSLPDQLASPTSFASRLAAILKIRKRHGIATGTLLDVPEVAVKSMLVLVNRLAVGAGQVTVLNFGPNKITGRVQSDQIPAGRVFDLTTRRKVDDVDDLGGFTVDLPAFGGLAMVVKEPPVPQED